MADTAMPGGPLGAVTCVDGETFCVSGSTGQIRAGGEQGLFIRDTRVLNVLLVRVDGSEPLPLLGRLRGSGIARFTAFQPSDDERSPDPLLVIERRRVVSASLQEEVVLTNHGVEPLTVDLEIEVGTDFAYIFDVKHGRRLAQRDGRVVDGVLEFAADDRDQRVVLRPSRAADDVDAEAGTLSWTVTVPARTDWTVVLQVEMDDAGHRSAPTRSWAAALAAADGSQPPGWPTLTVRCSDERLASVVDASVRDLGSLLVQAPAGPGDGSAAGGPGSDQFFAAGSPWYLTLFGRDSIWAASMALPLGAGVAGETLRVLARWQGARHDPETEEAPGKILHEIRRGVLLERGDLPPVYYGTIDATPLFVTLLNEAWRWGLPDEEVAALVDAAEAALGWLEADGDPDGDGFLEYRRSGGRGLSNQGWKDSADGISFADGRLAEPPTALCEVQGYAYEAALRGAELLDHFGRPGADRWRSWAASLRKRFRSSFWIDDPDGAYPAVALDGRKQRVDSVASNMGHLPATGILDDAECALVARRLSSPDMDSGWGLRTLSAGSPRFNPLSYHGGSVWPHDTAIAVYNLAAAGQVEAASGLLRGLVAAAPTFGSQLPELFGGEQRASGSSPLPYPMACRPQAWSAGAALLVLRALLGLDPHVPEGRLRLKPMWPAPFRQLHVGGVRVGGGVLSVTLVRDRGIFIHAAPEGLEVEVVGVPVLDTPPEPFGP